MSVCMYQMYLCFCEYVSRLYKNACFHVSMYVQYVTMYLSKVWMCMYSMYIFSSCFSIDFNRLPFLDFSRRIHRKPNINSIAAKGELQSPLQRVSIVGNVVAPNK